MPAKLSKIVAGMTLLKLLVLLSYKKYDK